MNASTDRGNAMNRFRIHKDHANRSGTDVMILSHINHQPSALRERSTTDYHTTAGMQSESFHICTA